MVKLYFLLGRNWSYCFWLLTSAVYPNELVLKWIGTRLKSFQAPMLCPTSRYNRKLFAWSCWRLYLPGAFSPIREVDPALGKRSIVESDLAGHRSGSYAISRSSIPHCLKPKGFDQCVTSNDLWHWDVPANDEPLKEAHSRSWSDEEGYTRSFSKWH